MFYDAPVVITSKKTANRAGRHPDDNFDVKYVLCSLGKNLVMKRSGDCVQNTF